MFGGSLGISVRRLPFSESHFSLVSLVRSGVTFSRLFSFRAMYSRGGGGSVLQRESGSSVSRLLWHSSFLSCRIVPISAGKVSSPVSLMSSHTTFSEIETLRIMSRSSVLRLWMSVSRPMGHKWASPFSCMWMRQRRQISWWWELGVPPFSWCLRGMWT